MAILSFFHILFLLVCYIHTSDSQKCYINFESDFFLSKNFSLIEIVKLYRNSPKEFRCLLPFIVIFASPSSPSPVTQQMTSMSISQDSGALDSDRVETEEAEEEGASTSTGRC